MGREIDEMGKSIAYLTIFGQTQAYLYGPEVWEVAYLICALVV